MDLSSLQKSYLLGIFKHMDLQSLIRARKTNKTMDDFVEKNRFRVKAVSSDEYPLVLHIRILPHPNDCLCIICQKETATTNNDKFKFFRFIQNPNPLLSECLNPFRCFSAVRFDEIHLILPERNEFPEPPCFNTLTKQLTDLRLSCHSISVSGDKKDMEVVPILLPLIEYRKMESNFDSRLEEYENWPLQYSQLNSIFVAYFPKELPSFFLELSLLQLRFYGISHSEWQQFLRQFIKNLKNDHKSKGNLQSINFIYAKMVPFVDFLAVLGSEIVWEGTSIAASSFHYPYAAFISKINIDVGFAYMLHYNEEYSSVYTMYFSEKEDDKGAVSYLTTNFPVQSKALEIQ